MYAVPDIPLEGQPTAALLALINEQRDAIQLLVRENQLLTQQLTAKNKTLDALRRVIQTNQEMNS